MGLFKIMLGGAVAGKVAGNTLYKRQVKQARSEEGFATIAAWLVDRQEKKARAREIASLNEDLAELGAKPLSADATQFDVKWTKDTFFMIKSDAKNYELFLDDLLKQRRGYRRLVRARAEMGKDYPDFEAYQKSHPVKLENEYGRPRFDTKLFDVEVGIQKVLERHYREEYSEFKQASHWNPVRSNPNYYCFPKKWLNNDKRG